MAFPLALPWNKALCYCAEKTVLRRLCLWCRAVSSEKPKDLNETLLPSMASADPTVDGIDGGEQRTSTIAKIILNDFTTGLTTYLLIY